MLLCLAFLTYVLFSTLTSYSEEIVVKVPPKSTVSGIKEEYDKFKNISTHSVSQIKRIRYQHDRSTVTELTLLAFYTTKSGTLDEFITFAIKARSNKWINIDDFDERNNQDNKIIFLIDNINTKFEVKPYYESEVIESKDRLICVESLVWTLTAEEVLKIANCEKVEFQAGSIESEYDSDFRSKLKSLLASLPRETMGKFKIETDESLQLKIELEELRRKENEKNETETKERLMNQELQNEREKNAQKALDGAKLIAKKDIQKSRLHYKQIIEKYPNTKAAKEAEGLLSQH